MGFEFTQQQSFGSSRTIFIVVSRRPWLVLVVLNLLGNGPMPVSQSTRTLLMPLRCLLRRAAQLNTSVKIP
jgi:hypothetical protein